MTPVVDPRNHLQLPRQQSEDLGDLAENEASSKTESMGESFLKPKIFESDNTAA